MHSGRCLITRCSLHTCTFSATKLRFRLWAKHRGEGDGIQGEPYKQAEVLEYLEFCDRMVDDAVDALDLDRTECGFSWYSMSKLERQFVNVRHIQHPWRTTDRPRPLGRRRRDSLGGRALAHG